MVYNHTELDNYAMIDILLIFLVSAKASGLILTTWLLLSAAFVGWGLAFDRILGALDLNSDRLFTGFWMGFALTILALQVWHHFLAVTQVTLFIFLIIGAIGLGINAARILTWFRHQELRARWVTITLILLAGLWVANRSSGPCLSVESGMYQILTVRWNQAYPAVPGLGNLHDRLAFNTSSLLYASMVESGPWQGRGNHIANGLLVFVLLSYIGVLASRYWRQAASSKPGEVFLLFLITPTVLLAGSEFISSFSTDLPPAIVCLIASSKAFILVQFALAICLKLSVVFFAFAGIALVLWQQTFKSRGRMTPAIRWGLPLVLLLILSLGTHGAILSGYPFYPSQIAAIPGEWRLPEELADAQHEWVLLSGRGSLLPGLRWIPHWAANQWKGNVYWFLYGIILPVAQLIGSAMFATWLIRKKALQVFPVSPALLVCLPMICGILSWFFLGPDPRFGFFVFGGLAASALTLVFLGLHRLFTNLKRPLIVAIIILGFLPTGFRAARALTLGRVDPHTHLPEALFIPPGPDHGLHPMPFPNLYRYTTDSGLELMVPKDDNLCWDSLLLCTPHPAPNLVQKQIFADRPAFVTIGPWAQLNWPNPTRDIAVEWRARRAKSKGRK